MSAEESSEQEIGIPDDVCKQAGIAASWVRSNKLGIYAYKHVDVNSPDIQSEMAPCNVKVHFIRPEVILFDPVIRKLVNESNGTFLAIQKLKTSTSDTRTELVKCSKQYRSILRACVENIQDSIESSTSESTKTKYQNYLRIFYTIECVWHLTEILYVDNVPGDVVLPQLLEWVGFHFPTQELVAMKILSQKIPGAEMTNVNYWKAVYGCALHGKLEIVRSLLALHSKASHKAFIAAEDVIKSMPVYSVYGGYTANEFMVRWKHWQKDVISLIDSKTFVIDDKLEALMKLVIGEDLYEFGEYTEAWYELLAAKLFYSVPCCKQSELARHANEFIGKANKSTDRMILALMESDFHQVIKEIQCINDNSWFAAHLTDLLYHCGRLKITDVNRVNVTDQLHESLILDYGSTLMEHNSLWLCGVSYLQNCPRQGMPRLEVLLQTVPLESETRVNRILDIAKDKNLYNVVKSICKIQGMKNIKRGRLGNALAWALKAQDGSFATYIADQFLKHYEKHGEILCKDLLENMGQCMLISDRLMFLGKYCEFQKTYSLNEFKDAAGLLMALITSNLTPDYFWHVLLSDAIYFLESKDMFFSSTDCYELERCAEEHGNSSEFSNKSEAFKIAASRHLARVLIYESCQEH